MARTFSEIKTSIKTKIRTYSSLDNFLFPEQGGSNLSIFNLFIDTVSAINFLTESIVENLKTEVVNEAQKAPSLNSAWVRQQMFNFQFGDTIELDENFTPFYSVPDDNKKIITRCAVVDRAGGGINIKVAKGTPPTLSPLTVSELDALKDYYYGTSSGEGIGGAGITANFISANSDKMKVGVNVFYRGQYSSTTIKTNVISAIDNYFATFADTAFDGTVFMIKLTDAIQSVEGVSRVVYTDVKARADSTPFASAQSVDFQGFYKTFAGYIVGETEPGNTLNDTVNVVLETI